MLGSNLSLVLSDSYMKIYTETDNDFRRGSCSSIYYQTAFFKVCIYKALIKPLVKQHSVQSHPLI